MDSLDVPPSNPPPPPPKKLSRPKITVQIPTTPTPRGPISMGPRGPNTGSVYWGPKQYRGRPPITPASQISDPHHPHFNPFDYMDYTKASHFMVKNFTDFKDFTMNTAKSGLSVGEKTAFWFYNQLRTLSKKWFTHFFLTICLILYSVMGATIFMTLEGRQETEHIKNFTDIRDEFVIRIKKSYEDTVKNRSLDFLTLIEKDLSSYEADFKEFQKHVNDDLKRMKTWEFWNSVLYAGTIYTTIGYGHIAPKTTYGRIATIIYAIIGIPLFLIVLADFGKLFTRIIKYFWAFIRRFYYTRNCRKVRRTETVMTVMKGLNTVCEAVRRPSQIFTEEDIEEDDVDLPPHPEKPGDEPPPLPPKPGVIIRDVETGTEPETPAPSVYQIDDEFNLPISVAIVILVMYIVIGAVIFKYFEQWEFFESFYFVFISMSTIGLGDFVPSRPVYMMVTMLYLVFGLALTSMCINVVQVKLSDTFKQASAKLSATIGLNTWSNEEDGVLDVKTSPSIEIAPVHKPKSEKEEIKSKENNENDPKND